MKQDKLAELSLAFGIEIMRLSHWLKQQNERVASYQVCKSGTSIGANIREAHYAQSKPDFISKLQIALKETNETYYWLELLYGAEYISKDSFSRLSALCNELRVLLIKSINTAKQNMKSNE
ncbi:MAG: four helix bundle protein [Oscillospiraceae bacterium]|nr:four helix bundle protein [Oscillospiraceae bacterium]MBR7010402.1 four helix bundle protein [Oscillospiraceae bacterium]